jgi:hypothetical protein
MDTKLEAFIQGYMDCMEWCNEDKEEFEDWGGEWDWGSWDNIRGECADFVASNQEDLEEYAPKMYHVQERCGYACAGHDFYLTRNGHGAGFWDRGLGELGDRLTKAAGAYGETFEYVGDDRKGYSE